MCVYICMCVCAFVCAGVYMCVCVCVGMALAPVQQGESVQLQLPGFCDQQGHSKTVHRLGLATCRPLVSHGQVSDSITQTGYVVLECID